MKKIKSIEKKRLNLDTETVRALRIAELAQVIGGVATAYCLARVSNVNCTI